MRATTAASGLAVVSGALTACGGGDSSSEGSDGPRVAFTHPAAQAGIVAVISKYAKEAMSKRGGEFTVGALANATPDAQYNLIDGWISQKYDAIEVFALDPVGLAPLQEKAQAAGIKWISYIAEMEGADATVGPDPTAQGTILADAFLDWVKTTGYGTKALVLDFSPIPTTQARVSLAADACSTQTDIEIVSTQDSVDTASAQQITENTLRAHPDLDVVLCLTDDAGVGALTAFENAGKDPATCFIGGCDGTVESIQAILGGTAFKASAAIDVLDFAEDMVGTAYALIEGEEVPPHTPAALLTPDTEDLARTYLSHLTGS